MNTAEGFAQISIVLFLAIVGATLVVTYWAFRKSAGVESFLTAENRITGFQNSLALAGDYLSAASFLGIAGMVSLSGFDGLVYSAAALVGWPIMLFLIAENMRRLGRYTFADVVAYRFRQAPVRIAAGLTTLIIIAFYTIVQMVGGGYLIRLLFDLDYELAELIVGVVMLAYVLFGGMLATTWVQIIKAVLLLAGATGLAVLVLAQFGFNPVELFRSAAESYGEGVLGPGRFLPNPWDTVSLALGYVFGVAALPHVLMRFYTVPDTRQARLSVVFATGWIGYFYLLTFVLGFGAMTLVGMDAIKVVDKGGNMAAPLLAAVVGGAGYMAFISAVAFATVLAVVAGLTLAGAAAVSHDLWTIVIRKGAASPKEQMLVARLTAIGLAVLAVAFGILFKEQNVGFMAGLAIAIAAAANFPALVLALFWRNCTTQGIVASVVTGCLSSILLICLSPTVQIDILHHAEAYFPLRNPGLLAIPLSFVVGVVTSICTRDRQARERFDEMQSVGAGNSPRMAGVVAGPADRARTVT
ncbi:cation acetate symporter [Bradyrhizobium sp. NP1]|uniref:sodium:solute symporter family transporter n=1 Tax=Bradyrhizobium sp. NP1 TaxID=3049772 RepID=UPI0025A616F0|nr:cation acetate symporter [Bradyrhizobium sp. NP1]WJR78658.1 cation acetate symporter [Bradyrhizobium sp. NP1]